MKTKSRSHNLFRRSTVLTIMIFPLLIILFSPAVSCKPEPHTPTPAPANGPTISIGEATTTIEGVVTVDIAIDGITEGISGYDLTVLLTGDSVAQVVDVVLPAFGLTDISELPSNQVTIRAVDLEDIVPSGNEKALLATIILQGVGLGTNTIDVIVNAMDDDAGNPIEPSVTTGTIQVR